MDKENSNNRASVWITFMFVLFYLMAVIFVNEILNTENFRNKLPHINTSVVGSRWIFYE